MGQREGGRVWAGGRRGVGGRLPFLAASTCGPALTKPLTLLSMSVEPLKEKPRQRSLGTTGSAVTTGGEKVWFL